jgi:hypothetical protein
VLLLLAACFLNATQTTSKYHGHKCTLQEVHKLTVVVSFISFGIKTYQINIFLNIQVLWTVVHLDGACIYLFLIYFLWLCNPAWAMASCGSAAQRGLWPPVALQPSAGSGLLWLCSPSRALASCGSAAHRGLWPPRPVGFLITHNDAPQSVGLLSTNDQRVAETST